MNPWVGAVAVVIGVVITGISNYLIQKWSDERRWRREEALRQAEQKREDEIRFLSNKADIYAASMEKTSAIFSCFERTAASIPNYEMDHVRISEITLEMLALVLRAGIYSSDEALDSLNEVYSCIQIIDGFVSRTDDDQYLTENEVTELTTPMRSAYTEFKDIAQRELRVATNQAAAPSTLSTK